VTGVLVNVSEVTWVMCDMERWTRGLKNVFRRSHGLCDVKSWVRYVTGEIVRFSPTSVIDGGGAQLIRRGQPSPIRLVFWVELGPMYWYVMGSGGPRPEGRRLAGIASWAVFRCAL